MRIHRLLLLGHYDRNAGDDAILLSLIGTMSSLPHGRVSIYVYAPKYFPNLEDLQREGFRTHRVASIFGLLTAFIHSQAVVLSGGDYLDDYGSIPRRINTFLRFLLVSLFTRAALKRFVMINAGLRPTSVFGIAWIRVILSFASCVTTRDRESFELASQSESKNIGPGFDTAVLLDYLHAIQSISPQEKEPVHISEKRYLGLSLTPVFTNFFGSPERDLALAWSIAQDLNRLLGARTHIVPCFLVLNTSSQANDLVMIRQVISMLDVELQVRSRIVAYSGDVYELLGRMSELDVVVCSKYHSILFAYLLSLPMMVIQYHPKTRALACEIGLPRDAVVTLEETLKGGFGPVLESLLDHPDTFVANFPKSKAKQLALDGVRKCIECALR